MKKPRFYPFALILTAALILAGCASNTEVGEESSGSLAFVDLVTIETQGEHQYARVEGHYPDACSRVSDVDQTFDGSTFKIDLYVDRPEDMMCAQMLSPFTVQILLEVGGVTPGEYTVQVNERSDTFTLGP
jgi:hypothetical protein